MGEGLADTLTVEKCKSKPENVPTPIMVLISDSANCDFIALYLKKKYDIWTSLRKMSGWRCDPLSGTLTAPDEVWNLEIVV